MGKLISEKVSFPKSKHVNDEVTINITEGKPHEYRVKNPESWDASLLNGAVNFPNSDQSRFYYHSAFHMESYG